MNTMTIDDRKERTDRFLQIMDRVTAIIAEIRAIEFNEVDVQPIETNFYKQVRHVLEAAQAIVETKIGVSIMKRCETQFCPSCGASDDNR
jgi:hypothetical protein